MTPIGLAIAADPREHPAPPGHPECHERIAGAIAALRDSKYQAITQTLKVRTYDLSLLSRVHSEAYIGHLAESASPDRQHDEETYQTASTFKASCDMTWSLLVAVDAAFGEGPSSSFILGRPPGHHAGREQAMGFCLVNHVAVAAQYARDHLQAARVAVVDFDVHHGNGTQDLFYDRSDVLYISTHQHPYYPGTGLRTEAGEGDGQGFTVNFPLSAGTSDTEFVGLFETEIASSLRYFRPDLILVSAGFDGHADDPLGGFNLTAAAFKSAGQMLRTVADDLCAGRLVSMLEGGYNPEANRESICHYIEGIAGL